jgi:hypothetical protein
MDAARLNDRVARGMGQAALHLGEIYEAFRPRDAFAPLSPANRLLCLNAAFHSEDKDWNRSARYDQPLWFAVYDTAYTQPGDYLRGPAGTFFIAAQPPLLPTVCVLTNRVLSFTRADGARQPGQNGYGGVQEPEETVLLDRWPASVLMAGAGGRSAGALPGEPGPANWIVRLPALHNRDAVELRQDDLLTDETGTRAVISAVERTELGWRLTTTQAIT